MDHDTRDGPQHAKHPAMHARKLATDFGSGIEENGNKGKHSAREAASWKGYRKLICAWLIGTRSHSCLRIDFALLVQ